MLRRVSNSAPGADTPQRAFDRALELASAALDESAASGERLAEVEAAVRELAIARSSDTEGLREQLAGIAESLENLRALIAEVAAGD